MHRARGNIKYYRCPSMLSFVAFSIVSRFSSVNPSHWLTGHCWLHQHGNSSVWYTGKRTEHSHMQTKAGYMQCVVATGDGYVILDKSDPGKVHWVDSQGRVTHTCGNREGEGLNDPRHMVRTSWEQLVVVDIYNYRLQYYTWLILVVFCQVACWLKIMAQSTHKTSR